MMEPPFSDVVNPQYTAIYLGACQVLGDASKYPGMAACAEPWSANVTLSCARRSNGFVHRAGVQVQEGVRLVGETGAALTRIIEPIVEIDSPVGDIVASAEQQPAGLQQVNTAVPKMDGVTQQNAAMVEQSTAAAHSLASDAEDMPRHIARFRIGTPEAPVKSAATPAAVARRRVVPQSVGNAALAVQDDHWAAF